VSRNTIVAGMKENNMPDENPQRVRRSGGGRTYNEKKNPTKVLDHDFKILVKELGKVILVS
jgi:hypothetical protein